MGGSGGGGGGGGGAIFDFSCLLFVPVTFLIFSLTLFNFIPNFLAMNLLFTFFYSTLKQLFINGEVLVKYYTNNIDNSKHWRIM